MSREPTTILIRISSDLASFFGTRTEDGRKLTFDPGPPVQEVEHSDGAGDPEPVYEPTITATDDGAHLCRCATPHVHRKPS